MIEISECLLLQTFDHICNSLAAIYDKVILENEGHCGLHLLAQHRARAHVYFGHIASLFLFMYFPATFLH